MKIAVVAANGRAGQAITIEARNRKHDVTAFGRGMNRTVTSNYINKDIFYLTKSDLQGFDAVVDAFGVWIPELFANYTYNVRHLCHLLKKTDTRLIVVGNSGSLYTDETHKELYYDSLEFPRVFKAVAVAASESWNELQKHDDVLWTYISPAANFQPDGTRTRKYIIAGDEIAYNERQESTISYSDFAIAVIDEIENGNYIQDRFSVIRK